VDCDVPSWKAADLLAFSIASFPQQIFSEGTEPRKGLAVLLSIGGSFACNDIVDVTDGKAFDIDVPSPRIFKTFDAIGCEDQIEVERAVFELHEILAAPNFCRLFISQRKPQLPQSLDYGSTVCRGFFDKEIGILGGIWKPDLPMNRYRIPWAENRSRISSA
jgi:hypothetical protein